jgi:hypothetical protein
MRLERDRSRRSVINLLLASAVFFVAEGALVSRAFAKKRAAKSTPQQTAKRTPKLKAGQFTWNPDRSPAGPIAVIVSIPNQHVYVYRNGIQIGVSTCSTGKTRSRDPNRSLHHS